MKDTDMYTKCVSKAIRFTRELVHFCHVNQTGVQSSSMPDPQLYLNFVSRKIMCTDPIIKMQLHTLKVYQLTTVQ